MKNRKTRIITVLLVLTVVAVVVGIGSSRVKQTTVMKTGHGDMEYHNELFGKNTYIFSPQDDPAKVQEVLDTLWQQQETNQFGEERYSVLFLPGEYDDSIQVQVGFYMQVAGLGILPTDTKLAALECSARWLGDDESNHNACCNFWRSVENVELMSNTMWAVSQATSMRRVQVDGALYLHDDYGWCSGGFLADSLITSMTDSGSQQQWLSRNNDWKTWMGENWNLVFVGEKAGCAPTATWPAKTYTTVEKTPYIEEKPYLAYEDGKYVVCVPGKREDSDGVSWKDGADTQLNRIGIEEFYVAKPDTDTAKTMNQALADGRNLLLTPGIYAIDEPLTVSKPDTIVLGMGLATLTPTQGNACMTVEDVDGVTIAGLLFDAGVEESDNLLIVGDETTEKQSHEDNPICLDDLYFRVGGTAGEQPGKVDTCVTINSSNVIGDNFWVWRADHGDNVAWDKNTARNGIVVNGDDVTIYALMVEHFEEYQTIWNGNGGRVYMYQSELPYDVPQQSAWMSHDGAQDGYASFYVADNVTEFESWGMGIYSYNRDAQVKLESAMEVPDCEGVRVHNICTVMLTGYPGIHHIINEAGNAVTTAGDREIICEYAGGILK